MVGWDLSQRFWRVGFLASNSHKALSAFIVLPVESVTTDSLRQLNSDRFHCPLTQMRIKWFNCAALLHSPNGIGLNGSNYDIEVRHFAGVVMLKKMNPRFNSCFFHNLSLFGPQSLTYRCNYTVRPLRKLASELGTLPEDLIKHKPKDLSPQDRCTCPLQKLLVNVELFKLWPHT